MVLKPEPLFEAVESLLGHAVGDTANPAAVEPKTAIVLMSQRENCSARKRHGVTRTGANHFYLREIEGVDERVAQHLATGNIH